MLRRPVVRRTVLVAALASAALGLAAEHTRAADPTPADRAAAEALFRDARKLMRSKDYPPACRKLEESQRLDPQGGTLLNLAVCHAREGRTASAWVEFQEAMEIARQAKRNDRVRLAKRELKQLENKLSRLTIEVPKASRLPGLIVHRGLDALGEGAWGTAVPVDPDSEIALEVEAPGYESWKLTVSLRPEEQKTVVIPTLSKLPPPPPKPHVRTKAEIAAEQEREQKKTERMIAYVVGGAGIVAVGVGSYFGLHAMSKKSETEEHCNGTLCDPTGLELNEQANRAATVSNVAFGVGLVALGVGSYFFVVSQPSRAAAPPEGEHEAARVRVAPSIAPGSGAILVSGRW
jgi:hypothetical protein